MHKMTKEDWEEKYIIERVERAKKEERERILKKIEKEFYLNKANFTENYRTIYPSAWQELKAKLEEKDG